MDNVNHPKHYTSGFDSRQVECIDITREMPFSLGNAFKYVWRAGKKATRAKQKRILPKRAGICATWKKLGSPTTDCALQLAYSSL